MTRLIGCACTSSNTLSGALRIGRVAFSIFLKWREPFYANCVSDLICSTFHGVSYEMFFFPILRFLIKLRALSFKSQLRRRSWLHQRMMIQFFLPPTQKSMLPDLSHSLGVSIAVGSHRIPSRTPQLSPLAAQIVPR